MFQCIQYNIVSNSNVGITGVSNHWTGIWNEIMECKMEWKRECIAAQLLLTYHIVGYFRCMVM